jgi:hypothetical protein
VEHEKEPIELPTRAEDVPPLPDPTTHPAFAVLLVIIIAASVLLAIFA